MNRRNFFGKFLAAIGVAAVAPKLMDEDKFKPVWDASHAATEPKYLRGDGTNYVKSKYPKLFSTEMDTSLILKEDGSGYGRVTTIKSVWYV